MYTKTEGIVLKEFRFRDTSKILTIFTRRHGKIHSMARGAYRPKSKLIANTQPFSYNDYYLFKGRNFYYINQADIIDSFYSIRENIHRMMYGSYLLELVDLSILEEEENEKLFLLLIKGLKILSKLDKDYNKFILAYELKYISFLGYKPSLDGCVICGRKNFENPKFSIDKGGIICPNCSTIEPYCENMDIYMSKAMKALLYTPLDKLSSIKIPKDTTFKLHEIMVKYILNKIERNQFNSLNILKSMKKNGGE
ncbi:DNA repair protein RecO [Clostridium sp. Cult2]|uniref:DNA repair protein RecO n=1 Tax=Clostridium sp. Cult2 TaxID=2079003 RepID=UPI001F020555|nr:DNA repair protein RecO [Clostridium sp. Cult2]MCF6466536.1 DNA repair protein RecO [Clostridium sp. Cult2]